MATYNDYQKLSDRIYGFGKKDDKGQEVTNRLEYTDEGNNKIVWEKMKDSNGNYLEINNTSSGYYGAVYGLVKSDEHGNNTYSEYVLVNQGTQITHPNDILNDAQMWKSQIPDQYADAKALMDQTVKQLGENADLTITGHSLGGALSQMLSVEYGNYAVTFNPFNIKDIMSNLMDTDFDELSFKSASLAQQIDVLTSGSGATMTEAEQLIADNLRKEKLRTDNILAAENLTTEYESGVDINNILNFSMVGDPVSNYIQKPHLGETIKISVGNELSGAETYYADYNTFLLNQAVDLKYHTLHNFSLEELQSGAADVYVRSSNGETSTEFTDWLKNFKDKTKFEVDDMGNNVVRINQEHEFYFGVVTQFSDWQTTGDDRSQLITKPYDQIYNKVSLATVGTAGEVMAARQSTIDFMLSQKYEDGSPMYAIKHDVVNPDKQTYLLFTSLPKNKKPEQYDPLALDLDGSGKVETVGLSVGVLFDHDADGIKTGTGWVAPGDGLVVRDINHDGQITSGRELFGDNTLLSSGQKAKNAFQAIADLDINHDGKVDSNDQAFGELKIWQDANLDGISQASELKSLTAAGVASISTHASITGVQNIANGNIEIGYSSFERADGTKGSSGAFNFIGDPINSEFTDTIDTSQVMDIPNINGSGRVRDLREAAALSPELAAAVRDYMKIDYPKDSDLGNIVKLWAATGKMDTLASTLKTGAHPNGARGTNLTPDEIDKLNILEKFTGLYAATSNFIDPMDIMDGRIDGRYTDQYYGINLDSQSINNTYASMLVDIEHSLFSAIGKTSVYDLIDYKYANGKISINFDRVLEWAKNTNNHEYATAQIANMLNNVANNQSVLIGQSDISKVSSYLSENISLYRGFTQYLSDNLVLNIESPGFDNLILGGGGSNTLVSYDGDNIFLAGKGNDILKAGTGNDQYLFNLGDGHDEISDFNGVDTIVFGEGITASHIQASTINQDVLISFSDGNGSILIKNSNMQSTQQIEYFKFADGTKLTYSELILPMLTTDANDFIVGSAASDFIQGKDGDDTIYGNGGDDIFIGGKGSDTLTGGSSNDKYIFNVGDGIDRIFDYSGNDTIIFGEGISKENLQPKSNGNDLFINIISTSDKIQISGMHIGKEIEYLEFANGEKIDLKEWALLNLNTDGNDIISGFNSTNDVVNAGAGGDVIYGQDGNDTLYGDVGNDTLYGGTGNDILDGGDGDDYLNDVFGNNTFIGGAGNDYIYSDDFSGTLLGASNTFISGLGNDYISSNSYKSNDEIIFNLGDGQDIVYDGGGTDTIKFGEGITASDISARDEYGDLVINVGRGGDSITVQYANRDTNRQIENFQFSDGNVISYSDLILPRLSTAGDDYIFASNVDDVVYGKDGNDQIFGNGGNDILNGGNGNDYIDGGSGENTIIGGKGNDTLTGGYDNDKFIFNLGDGVDRIFDSYGNDGVVFGEGISEDNLRFTSNGNDLFINIANTLDKIQISGMHTGAEIEYLEFANGEKVDLKGFALPNLITEGNDVISGFNSTDDVINAGAGGDVIYGRAGNDKLDGGEGNDILDGGYGVDTLIGGAGNDYLNESGYSSSEGNIFFGGAGADRIIASGGKDLFIFNIGDGKDNVSTYGVGDILRFGGGIQLHDLSFTISGYDLIIKVGNNGDDSITIKDVYSGEYSSWQNLIEFLEFSDGTSVKTSEAVVQLFGNESNEAVIGFDADEIFNALGGHDYVNGMKGNDIIDGGDGHDTLYGGEGNDSIIGGIGHDTVFGGTGNDRLSGGDGYDTLYGGSGDDYIDGGDGDDTIYGESGRDELRGGAGIDYIRVSAVNNQVRSTILFGGKDNDYLQGSFAGDIYVFNRGDAQDTINDLGENNGLTGDQYNSKYGVQADAIEFGSGISKEELSYERLGNDLLIKVGDSGSDSITIKNHFTNQYRQIEVLSFADGSKITQAEMQNVLLTFNGTNNTETINGWEGRDNILAKDGDDKVYANGGNDIVSGGAGNDYIEGSVGDDVIDGGTGNDKIYGQQGSNKMSSGDGDDYIEASLGDVYASQRDIAWQKVGQHDGNNLIEGGKGNDVLVGGWRGDTYIYNKGDGKDIIIEPLKNSLLGENHQVYTETDKLVFGAGISQSELNFKRINDDLLVQIDQEGNDSIRIKSWYRDSDRKIEQLIFTDGGQVTASQIDALNLEKITVTEPSTSKSAIELLSEWDSNSNLSFGLNGVNYNYGDNQANSLNETSGIDFISGGGGNDVIVTHSYNEAQGNDYLDGGDGDDILQDTHGDNVFIGGKDNDIITGAERGKDTYVFNAGDGRDIIRDSGAYYNGIGNILQLGSGISLENLYLTKVQPKRDDSDYTQSGFTLRFNNNPGDSIYFIPGSWDEGNFASLPINTIVFADGSSVSMKEIPLTVAQLNQNNPDFNGNGEDYVRNRIVGGDEANNIVIRYAGSITIDSGGGNDYILANNFDWGSRAIINAGAGNDEVIIEMGHSYESVINVGAGTDKILTPYDGNDSYIYNEGDGQDTISDFGGNDTLRFGERIRQSDLAYNKSGNDLLISIGTNRADSITIKDHFINSNRQIEVLSFADGSTLTRDQYLQYLSQNLTGTEGADTLTGSLGADTLTAKGGNDTLDGKAGNDILDAGAGDDTLTGSLGNDTLSGGNGNDSYIYTRGDGKDIISDSSGNDKIILNQVTSIDKVLTTRNLTDNGSEGDDLILGLVNEDGSINDKDQITLKNWFNNPNNQIETLMVAGTNFALAAVVEERMTKLKGTDGDDNLVLSGKKNEVAAGKGNDTISDTTLNNTTYLFNAGDGKDSIIDANSTADKISFGNGVNQSNLKFSQSGSDLLISLTNPATPEAVADQITIKDFASQNNRIENLVFADGSNLNLADKLKQLNLITDSTNLSKLKTSNGDDLVWLDNSATVNLREGNNTLFINSLGGLSTITAGAGNDRVELFDNGNSKLSLGNGNNNVKLNNGDNTIITGTGNDLINAKDGNNTIRAGDGQNQISLGRGTNSITTGIGNDQITINGGNATISSGAGDDTIIIQNLQANETAAINSGAGNDQITINGTGGLSKLTTGTENDEVTINGTNSQISDSGGDNKITINNLNLGINATNTITLNKGNDTVLLNSDGTSIIKASDGENQIIIAGNLGTNTVTSGSGTDILTVSGQQNTISAGNGANQIAVAGISNKITTGIDNDEITINSGSSTISSGTGDDTITIQNLQANETTTINSGAGNDQINISGQGGIASITGGTGDDKIKLTNTVTTIKDSGGNNQISIDNSLLGNEINSITLGGGHDSLQMISNGTTTIKTSTGDKEIILAGTGTYSVTTSSGNDLISGGSANDIINSLDGNDTLSGKQGNDILNGGKGNDTYLFAKGDGQDIIQDNQGSDKIIFGKGITKENLWFKKQAKDLNITNTSTQDQLTVKNWYAGTTNQIESIELATGESIGNQSINLLVQAMAAFNPQPMADSGTSQPLPQAVQTAIGNTWIDPTA